MSSDFSRYSEPPFVDAILCVTDFSAAGINAFAHALMIAMNIRCELTLLHASKAGSDEEWSRLPGVRELLERWGYLEPGSPRSAVFERTAVQVRKVMVSTGNATTAILDFLEHNPVDLLVLGAEGREGVAAWLRPGSHPMLNATRTMTLFVPAANTGFVSPEHGGFRLKRVLTPIASLPSPQPAITYAFRAAVASSEELVEMYLLYVADSQPVPQVNLPERSYLSWVKLNRMGNASSEILKAARQLEANLIVMTTEGRDGILDSLRGSVTRKVLRRAPCPVLAVPLGR